MNYIQSCKREDHTVFDYSHYIYGGYGKQALEYEMLKYKEYFCKVCQEPALEHNWQSCNKESFDKQGLTLGIA